MEAAQSVLQTYHELVTDTAVLSRTNDILKLCACSQQLCAREMSISARLRCVICSKTTNPGNSIISNAPRGAKVDAGGPQHICLTIPSRCLDHYAL